MAEVTGRRNSKRRSRSRRKLRVVAEGYLK